MDNQNKAATVEIMSHYCNCTSPFPPLLTQTDITNDNWQAEVSFILSSTSVKIVSTEQNKSTNLEIMFTGSTAPVKRINHVNKLEGIA